MEFATKQMNGADWIAVVLVLVFLVCSLISAAAGIKYLLGGEEEAKAFSPPPAGGLFQKGANETES